MAGLFFESFDHYDFADILQKWTTYSQGSSQSGDLAIGSSYGRHGNGLRVAEIYIGNTDTGYFRMAPSNPAPSGSTFIIGFAFYNNYPFANYGVAAGTNVIAGARYLGNFHCYLRFTSTGTFQVCRGVDNTVLGTSTLSMNYQTWHYIEFKVVIHGSTGTVDVKLDGQSAISLTGQNTAGAGSTYSWDEFQIGPNHGGSTSANHEVWYDDLYVCDGSGSYNNDFLGDIRVDAVFPASPAGNSSQWTRSTGSDQWATIDEAAANEDTDYNSTATLNNLDTLNFPDAPVAGADILAVQVCMSVRKTDAGSAGIKAVTRQSSTDYLGVEHGIPNSYVFKRQVWDRQPVDGTSAWTDTAFNAAEFGYKKTS